VLIAYVDESGDLGPSHTYTLGCVLVDAESWPASFDALIGFRRFLRKEYGLLIRAELKANYILRNEGPFESLGLPEGIRYKIYRGAMRLHAKLGFHTFAVVIRKAELSEDRPELSARDVAWDYLLQRLRTASTRPPLGPTPVMLAHDEGEAATIRRLARRARRAGTAGSKFGTEQLSVPFERLVDDPISKKSIESYFVQLADLTAYAAFRRLYPPPPDSFKSSRKACGTNSATHGTTRSQQARIRRGSSTGLPPRRRASPEGRLRSWGLAAHIGRSAVPGTP
jgi:Protein of unknown function (DUF3800)